MNVLRLDFLRIVDRRELFPEVVNDLQVDFEHEDIADLAEHSGEGVVQKPISDDMENSVNHFEDLDENGFKIVLFIRILHAGTHVLQLEAQY